MPHLTLEYSTNIRGFDARQALAALNASLVNCGQFEEEDVKSRAIPLDTFSVGTQQVSQRAFIHAKLALLSGRSAETKRALSAGLLHDLRQLSGDWDKGMQIQLCVEILDIDRDSYAKATVSP